MKKKILILCSSLLIMAFFLFPQNEVQANLETPIEIEELKFKMDIHPCEPGDKYLYRIECHLLGSGPNCNQSTLCN